MPDSFLQLFPTAQRVSQKIKPDFFYHLPLDDGHFLAIPKADVSPSEDYLLQQLLNASSKTSSDQDHPWYRYLVSQSGPLPKDLTKLQVLHCYIEHRGGDKPYDDQWLSLMTSLFPNLICHFSLDEQHLVFLIHQVPFFPVREVLEEVLPSLEFDFEMKLSFLIGQMWPARIEQLWPTLFQLEHNLFQEALKQSGQLPQVAFSTLLLKSQMMGNQDTALLFQQLKGLIETEDMEAIVKALWKEQAVLTKTAQSLYLHRNTLQYRLDKFQEQTGLWLRHMDDLATCYLALLS